LAPYEIVWSENAKKRSRAIDRAVRKRIYDEVSRLASDPDRRVKRIVAPPYHGLRVGDYRVLVDVQEGVWRVLVIEVGHRSTV